jgi:biotin carboxyl carrier protein
MAFKKTKVKKISIETEQGTIDVKEGQEVKEGDLVMILEAMKMLNKIYCPMDGIVKKIYISDEEKVPKGHLMIELT